MKKLKRRFFTLGILLVILIFFWLYKQTGTNIFNFFLSKFNPLASIGIISKQTLDYSDGECNTKSDCDLVKYGCGQSICTSNPAKYERQGSICPINKDFPAYQGYMCSCIKNMGKCGWVR